MTATFVSGRQVAISLVMICLTCMSFLLFLSFVRAVALMEFLVPRFRQLLPDFQRIAFLGREQSAGTSR
jgi:hypothetical protein